MHKRHHLTRLKIIVFIVAMLYAYAHHNQPQTQAKQINAPYSGTCIIKRALEIHQMDCEIQPNNVAVIYQR